MAGDLTLALRAAQSGLLANQGALDTVANNIANVNSPGYSRKIVNLEQRVVAGQGAGVTVSDVTRKVDEALLKSLRLETSALSAIEAQTSSYERMQEVFGSPNDNTSLSHIIASFSEAIETLAVSPDKTLEQSDVVRWGQNIAAKFQSMSKTIQELRLQADKRIGENVTEINRLISRIGELNDDIISNSTVNRDVTDLDDRRAQSHRGITRLGPGHVIGVTDPEAGASGKIGDAQHVRLLDRRRVGDDAMHEDQAVAQLLDTGSRAHPADRGLDLRRRAEPGRHQDRLPRGGRGADHRLEIEISARDLDGREQAREQRDNVFGERRREQRDSQRIRVAGKPPKIRLAECK